MSENNRQVYIKILEESIIEHENIIDTIHEKLSHLYEAERQANIKLFIARIELTISDGDVLIVTAQFDDYVSIFLVEAKRLDDLKLWIQRKKGNLRIYNHELDDEGQPVIDVKWQEMEYKNVGGHYFQNGMMPIFLHTIYFRNIPIEIIKSCIK